MTDWQFVGFLRDIQGCVAIYWQCPRCGGIIAWDGRPDIDCIECGEGDNDSKGIFAADQKERY